jgi:hypothetical protein
MRYGGFVGFDGNSDLLSRVDPCCRLLSGLLIVFGFDQQCLRYKIKRHGSPLCFFGVDFIGDAALVKL